MRLTIKNARVLLWEPHCQIREKDVHIDGSLISQVGKAEEGFEAQRVIDAQGKLLMPGLINCHGHAYMSLFRNYADDLPFDDWLFKKIMPAEDAMKSEDAYWCNLLSCLEMIKTGTTCYTDMQMFKHMSVRSARESGMRAVISRGLVGDSPQDQAARTRLDEAFEEMDAAAGESRISFMLGPHAIYTCGEALLKELPDMALERGIGQQIHILEGKTELEDSLKNHGCSSIKYLESLDFFRAPTLAAHCVHIDQEDIEILARRGVSVASNPMSNMKLGNGFAPVPRLLQAGVNVCLGTDSAASNNALNMFREMSMVSYIHKGLEQDALCMNAEEALRCGTLRGARALGLETIGAIRAGMKADLILIDMDRPWMQPVNNPLFSLIYSANGTEVDTVIIDGEIIMEKGRVLSLDEEKIRGEVESIRKRLLV
ncbi:MAG: amidohydrolase [Treponema sp.]|nr:amidohydrolase [Treponema sp.]